MTDITLQSTGTRIYVVGNTYGIKDAIKAAGGHWDGERRAWWVGQAKAAEIARVVREAATQTQTQAPAPSPDASRGDRTPDRDAKVKARATYKGQDYYVLAETRDGAKLLLAARNGQFQFWAETASTQITKTYGRENYRTGRDEYPTLGSMMARADKWRHMSAEDRTEAREDAEARSSGEACPCSGGACRCGTDSPCCMCW